MRYTFLLAIMLIGSFAFANNFTPNVSSEINKETETFTYQTDVLSVKSNVILDCKYQIEENSSSSEEGVRCYFRLCRYDSGGTKWCTEWEEVPCNATIIVIISPGN